MLILQYPLALGAFLCLLSASLVFAKGPKGEVVGQLRERFDLKEDTEIKVKKMGKKEIKFGEDEFSIKPEDLEAFDPPTTPSTTYSINGVETSDPPPSGLFVSKDDPSVLIALDEEGKFLRATRGRGGRKKMLIPVEEGSKDLAVIDDEDTDFDKLNSEFRYGSLPLPDDAAAVQANDYWIGRRGLRHTKKKEGEAPPTRHRRLQTCTTFDEIKLAIAFDSSFCDLYGGNWGDARDRVLELVDGASAFYEKDNVCMRLVVSHIDGHCGHGSDDVYEQMLDGAADIGCSGSDGLLQQFMYFWRANRASVHRDATHLMYGRYSPYSENTIGCAYVGATCWDDWHYGVNEMNFTMGTSRQEQLFARELAHNAGAYDDQSCTDCIMQPQINGATTFSDQTAASFFEHKKGVNCIGNSLIVTSLCGDGMCEGGETIATCPTDCPIKCLDGICSDGEDSTTCPEDCDSSCGDGVCNGDENPVLCFEDCPTECGDSYCAGEEDPDTCLEDCPPDCGDGICNGDETDVDCAVDCAHCGDGTCNGDEDDESCPDDCVQCGDEVCNGEENAETCPTDCEPICGDGFCSEEAENASTCADDCPSECGDGFCTGDETADECPGDCVVCGDGDCNGGETPDSCEVDCAYCGDGTCNSNESFDSCDMDCDPVCGNGVCEEGELLETCPQDCAVCDDGICTTEGNETVHSCPSDCATCGDEVCSVDIETLESCPIDCTVCGDGVCSSPAETIESCETDCALCGDSICSEGETLDSCPKDCVECGDGVCGDGEICDEDCALDVATCGDGICALDENQIGCPEDCGQCLWPGDGLECTEDTDCCFGCTKGKSKRRVCALAPSGCGNRVCEESETETTCPYDCPTPACGMKYSPCNIDTDCCSNDCRNTGLCR